MKVERKTTVTPHAEYDHARIVALSEFSNGAKYVQEIVEVEGDISDASDGAILSYIPTEILRETTEVNVVFVFLEQPEPELDRLTLFKQAVQKQLTVEHENDMYSAYFVDITEHSPGLVAAISDDMHVIELPALQAIADEFGFDAIHINDEEINIWEKGTIPQVMEA